MKQLLKELDRVINEEKDETTRNCLKLVKLHVLTIQSAKELKKDGKVINTNS